MTSQRPPEERPRNSTWTTLENAFVPLLLALYWIAKIVLDWSDETVGLPITVMAIGIHLFTMGVIYYLDLRERRAVSATTPRGSPSGADSPARSSFDSDALR